MRLYVSRLLFALVAALLTPISAEAQVSDVDCAAIIDSDGTRVARWQGGLALFGHEGKVARLHASMNAANSSRVSSRAGRGARLAKNFFRFARLNSCGGCLRRTGMRFVLPRLGLAASQ